MILLIFVIFKLKEQLVGQKKGAQNSLLHGEANKQANFNKKDLMIFCPMSLLFSL